MERPELEEAWPADEPPNDFAERVVERALEERREEPPVPERRGPGRTTYVVLALAAAAALLLWWRSNEPSRGDVVAAERTEARLGNRAIAVLEPGSHLAWLGEAVTQDRGDVFYRVEPGSRFVVRTPAGEVAVLGTCFRVKVGASLGKGAGNVKKRDLAVAAGGATLAALAVVTVYEGKVQLSHAGERVDLRAGEAGKLGPGGTARLGADELADAEGALGSVQPASSSLASANDRLAGDIADLNQKLKEVEKKKGQLEQQLSSAEAELAKRTDGGSGRGRSEFDLDQQDWSDLAKEGTIKYRVPCMEPGGWKPSAERIDELGLAPDDVEPIRAAYQRSYERMWKTIRPLCAKAVGNADVVDVLGPDTCIHVVVDAARKQDSAAYADAVRLLGEIRAGQRAAPAPGTPASPVFELFWALTGELGTFEADLAQSFGPDEAKRLAFAKGMCAGHSTFGGPGPKKPEK